MVDATIRATIRLTHKVCPSFYDRVDIAIRSRLKYQQLKRDKPLPSKQVYDPNAKREAANRQGRKRWKRNLKRYAKMYEKARVPGINPPTDEIIDDL